MLVITSVHLLGNNYISVCASQRWRWSLAWRGMRKGGKTLEEFEISSKISEISHVRQIVFMSSNSLHIYACSPGLAVRPHERFQFFAKISSADIFLLIIKISCVFFVGFPRPRASTTISKKEISGILVPSRSRWWNGILNLIARRTPSLSGRRRQFQKIKLMLCRAQVTNFFLFLLSFVFFSYIFILFLLVCLSDVSPDSLLRLERDTASLGALLKGGISRDLNKIRYFIYEYKLSGNITQCPLRVTMCD